MSKVYHRQISFNNRKYHPLLILPSPARPQFLLLLFIHEGGIDGKEIKFGKGNNKKQQQKSCRGMYNI